MSSIRGWDIITGLAVIGWSFSSFYGTYAWIDPSNNLLEMGYTLALAFGMALGVFVHTVSNRIEDRSSDDCSCDDVEEVRLEWFL